MSVRLTVIRSPSWIPLVSAGGGNEAPVGAGKGEPIRRQGGSAYTNSTGEAAHIGQGSQTGGYREAKRQSAKLYRTVAAQRTDTGSKWAQ